MRCGLNAGILAESSEVDSARLVSTRTSGRTRTTSRLPTLLMVETRMIWRAALASPIGGSLSLLRVVFSLSALRTAASKRWARSAKLVSPSREAKTAPPIRAAPHRPVRIVPLNHCTETRRRSTLMPISPSTDSGGSLPRSMVAGSKPARCGPRGLTGSKCAVPSTGGCAPTAESLVPRPGSMRRAALPVPLDAAFARRAPSNGRRSVWQPRAAIFSAAVDCCSQVATHCALLQRQPRPRNVAGVRTYGT